MSTRRREMRRKAEKNLERKGKMPEKIEQEVNEPPSIIRGFLLIFLGTFTTILFISGGQVIIGIFVGGPFILIGSYRINRASMIHTQSKKRTVDFSETPNE